MTIRPVEHGGDGQATRWQRFTLLAHFGLNSSDMEYGIGVGKRKSAVRRFFTMRPCLRRFLARSTLTLMFLQIALAQTDALRRDLDQLVILDELNRILQR